MKKIKWLALILAVVMLLSTACGLESVDTGATRASFEEFTTKATAAATTQTTKVETEQTEKETQNQQTVAPTQKQEASQEQDSTNSRMVWIPKTGKKYHSHSGCSNMKNPSKVTITQAKNMGYTACKKCW